MKERKNWIKYKQVKKKIRKSGMAAVINNFQFQILKKVDYCRKH
jgi:hypothetical protein